MATTLGNAIQFLTDFGFFTVVLPFLLVFTIVFGILEKTKIFGVENNKPKKNLNAMVAFVIAFFVIAASNIVTAIQISLPWISLILIIIICFLLLSGTFLGDEEYKLWEQNPAIAKWFIGLILVGILAIFLYAFDLLGVVLGFIGGGAGSTVGSTVILIILIIAAIWFIVGKKSEDDSSD